MYGYPDTSGARRRPVSPASFSVNTTPNVSPYGQTSGVVTREPPGPPSPLSRGGPSTAADRQHLSRATTDSYFLRPPTNAGPSSAPLPTSYDFQRSATDFPAAAISTSASHPQQQSQSSVQKAFADARHFLGGLIEHPTESTKHFTILRHSHGIVFYRGITTTVTISVFADAPLPPDRTYWLQDKGFTGKTGMKAKALMRLNDDWLDLTPTLALRPDQVNPNDERAWQRDLSKFRKKAPSRIRDKHILRETVVARVPAGAEDGYYSILLCHGPKKKVLCTSPTFRIMSTSMDPSSIRGASLSTLPLELGAMAIGGYAQTLSERVINPVTNVVQPYLPGVITQTAAETAYAVKEDTIAEANDQYAQVRGGSDVDIQQGPLPPYPLNFHSLAEMPGDREHMRMPRMTLVKPPEQTLRRLHGYYFGWARLEDATSKKQPPGRWIQVVLSVLKIDLSQLARVSMSDALKRVATLRFLDDVNLPGQAKVEVRILGFIRPDSHSPDASGLKPVSAENQMMAEATDASIALNILNHPAWGPDSRPQNTSLTDRYGSLQLRGQQLFERVPLHKVGIRKPGDDLKDKQLTVNGFYIKRG